MLPEDVAALNLPLPRHCKDNIKTAFYHAAALAHQVVTYSRGWAADSPLVRVRQASEIERLRSQLAIAREYAELLRSRFSRLPASQRPNYTPIERDRILRLMALTAWSFRHCAKMLHPRSRRFQEAADFPGGRRRAGGDHT